MCAYVCVCVRGCAWVCVGVRGCAWVCVCVCYKIFELFEACNVDSADYTVGLYVSVSLSMSVLP